MTQASLTREQLEVWLEIRDPSSWEGEVAIWDDAVWDGVDVGWSDNRVSYVNVACDVRGFVIERGRQSNWDNMLAANIDLEIDNSSGRYSIYGSESWPRIRPGFALEIWALWKGERYPLFVGTVSEYVEAQTPDDYKVSLKAHDAFYMLAVPIPGEYNPGSPHEPGDSRINGLLDRAGFTGPRNIQGANATMLNYLSTRSVLDEIQLTATSDGGVFFIDNDGTAMYMGQTRIFGRPRPDGAVVPSFSDSCAEYVTKPYLDPSIGTVSTGSSRTDSITSDPPDAASYTYLSGGNRYIGKKSNGAIYPDHILWMRADTAPVPQVDGYFTNAGANSVYVTTPDTPDLTIDGDIRFTSKVRVVGGDALNRTIAAQRGTNQFSWQSYINSANQYGLRISYNGTTIDNGGSGAAQAPGPDTIYRTEMRMFQPSGTGRASSLSVDNGQTWQSLGGYGTTRGLPFDSTSPIIIGAHTTSTSGYPWNGRIYWAQMEAINRAQLWFSPTTQSDKLTVPFGAWPANIEFVARVSLRTPTSSPPLYRTLVGRRTSTDYDVLLRRATGSPCRFSLHWKDSANAAFNIIADIPGGTVVADQLIWVRALLTATDVSISYSTQDTPTLPTSWTVAKTQARGGGAGIESETADLTIGSTGGSTPYAWDGRIARVIITNPDTAAVLLDVSENDAGVLDTPTTFTARSGQTVTVVNTGLAPIINPQPDKLMWRFDANDYPGNGTTYTDPNNRTWTLSSAAVIVPKVPAVPPQLVWMFNPADYLGGDTTYTDPRGRVWTLTAADAIYIPPVGGAGLPYAAVEPIIADHEFGNVIVVSNVSQGTDSPTSGKAVDEESIEMNGAYPWSPDQLVLCNADYVQPLADFQLSRRSTSFYRINSFECYPIHDDGLWDALLPLRVGDSLFVTRTPPGSRTIFAAMLCDGMRIEATPDMWKYVIRCSPGDSVNVANFWDFDLWDEGTWV